MKKIFCLLQNAWSPLYAGTIWPRNSWLKALHSSRSGQRLKVLINECPKNIFYFDNTTQEVTEKSSGIATTDFDHLQDSLHKQKPDIILTCGDQARYAILYMDNYIDLNAHILSVPHPASRVLKNSLYKLAGKMLANNYQSRLQLVQQKEFIEVKYFGLDFIPNNIERISL